jgi:glycosyltransferase involved in cell wall biosynthesis
MSLPQGRVIVVTPNEPFPFGQANGRWCHALLKGLADAGWDVRCLSVTVNDAWERGARDAFAGTSVRLQFYRPGSNGTSTLRRKWRTLKEPFSYTYSDSLRRDLDRELTAGYDVLHLEQLWAGYLARGIPRALTSVHHLERLDLSGVWRPSRQFLTSKLLMLSAERRLLARLGRVRATTDRLAREMAGMNPAASIGVVPIALDPAMFACAAADRHDEPVFGFIGSMNWIPGYRAAVRLITRILPRVRARRPDARVLLVGWNARRFLSAYLQTPGVEIVESVPDAEPYFRKLQVFAYPLSQGSGMMAKVLEAMAYGVPIVTTTEGMEGFDAQDGVHASIADDDDAFAERVVRLLGDRAARQAFRTSARALVQERYSPGPAVARLERLYSSLS